MERYAKFDIVICFKYVLFKTSSHSFIYCLCSRCISPQHVIFGEVIEPSSGAKDINNAHEEGEGMKVIDRIMELVEVNPKNHRPKNECAVVIEACGQVSD